MLKTAHKLGISILIHLYSVIEINMVYELCGFGWSDLHPCCITSRERGPGTLSRMLGGCELVWTSVKRKSCCCFKESNPDFLATIRKMCVGLSLSLGVGFFNDILVRLS
jgi:hypothetical protein